MPSLGVRKVAKELPQSLFLHQLIFLFDSDIFDLLFLLSVHFLQTRHEFTAFRSMRFYYLPQNNYHLRFSFSFSSTPRTFTSFAKSLSRHRQNPT